MRMVYHSAWSIVWLGLLLALPANAADHRISNRLPSKLSPGHSHADSKRRAHHADCEMAGMASFYGNESGPKSASGEAIDPSAMAAAHPSLPFGTKVRVTNQSNGRSVVVTINDRGPFVHGRVIDLSTAAAVVIGMRDTGVASVRLEVVGN